MSRPLRLEYAGAVWHVTSRGNERRDVFRDDVDRDRFVSILGRTVTLFRWRLHAFVLMSNHYHLLLETTEPTLSRGMRQLNGVYTQAFNRRHRRVGHLFQGRFKAVLVEKEVHLLELCRYVVLNPVRAGIVKSARDWPWSSFRATAAHEPAPAWLETEWTVRNFGRVGAEAINRYRRFVAEGARAGYEPWAAVRGQIYLGRDEFLGEVQRRADERKGEKGFPRSQRRPKEIDPDNAAQSLAGALGLRVEEIRSKPRIRIKERRLFAWALRRHALCDLATIARILGVGLGQASSLARAGEKEVGRDRRWNHRMAEAIAG